jgi:hypothetical protein
MTTLKTQFDKFDAENPHVWDLFVDFTKKAVGAGMKKLSVALIIERIRWECNVETTGDRFKISNNHSAYYARKFHSKFPELGQVFTTHPVRS